MALLRFTRQPSLQKALRSFCRHASNRPDMGRTNKIALVTDKDRPEIRTGAGDHRLVEALAARGFSSLAVPWNQSDDVNWDEFDAAIMRCNYHKAPEEFHRWILDRMSCERPRMWNSPDTVLWNMNKQNYLTFFKENGVPVPDTEFIERGSSPPNLRTVLQGNSWEKAVVKPVISAAAYRTFSADQTTAPEKQTTFEEYLKDGDMMIQEYLEEVHTTGEYSLIYFDKHFSHAMQKVPAEGDYRVQRHFGGSELLVAPPEAVRDTAERILSLVVEDLVYARVDLIVAKGGVLLMELELIEPDLYLNAKEDAAEKFAEALMKCQFGVNGQAKTTNT